MGTTIHAHVYDSEDKDVYQNYFFNEKCISSWSSFGINQRDKKSTCPASYYYVLISFEYICKKSKINTCINNLLEGIPTDS